jgi:proline iminopeptidase
MDPKAMEALSKAVQKGQYLYCPNGSHMSMYDDQQTYFKGLIRFLKETGK